MDPVGKDVKEAVCEAEKFFSVTLAKEKLSPAAEIERTLLADKFRKLKTQLGLQNELSGGGKGPPRPPKGKVPVPVPVPAANDDLGGEELYDDVAAVIAQDDQYYEMSQGVEGNDVPTTASADMGGENYEVMSAEQENEAQGGEAAGEDYMAMEDDLGQEDYVEPQAENTADENYEVTEQSVKPPAPAEQEENYEIPGADEDYEVTDTDHSAPKDADGEMYEGIEAPDSLVDGTVNWDQLKQSTSPEKVQGVIITGFLNKRRKEGKVYLGSKFQKRFCVVRNHAMYYFKDKKANKQQGHILLPGYKVQLANKRGREFHLTHSGGQRTYQFETNSKEETEKWIKAIQRACDAPLSEHQRAKLEELRNRHTAGDDDSLHYVDASLKNEAVEEEDEVYDDTQEDLYEAVETVQSPVSNHPSPGPLREVVDYEVSPTAVPSKQAPLPLFPGENKTVEPIQEEEYELPEASAPPPRPSKTEPMPPIPSEDKPPEIPPPRPSKGQPSAPPVPPARPVPQQDDMYEVAEPNAPDNTSDLPPPPPPVSVEENYEVADTQAPAPPPMRPPKRPQPQIPQPPVIPPVESPAEKAPERPSKPAAKSQPPAPKPKDEPPPSPKEVQTIEINYANIYQALWTCEADDKDELAFRRGDLIYIYEKPHNDWWIGSLFKPQGYSVGLVPKKYVMEAYEMTA